MEYRLDDHVRTGERMFVFDSAALARKLDVSEKVVKKALDEAVGASEALKVGETVVISARMVKEYLPKFSDRIVSECEGSVRLAVGETYPSLVPSGAIKIKTYSETVFVSIAQTNFARSEYELRNAELEERLIQSDKKQAVLDSASQYEARIAKLEELLVQSNAERQRQDKNIIMLRARAESIPEYEARIEAILKENQSLRLPQSNLETALLNAQQMIERYESQIAALQKENTRVHALYAKAKNAVQVPVQRESDEAEISVGSDFVRSLRQKIQSLEQDLRRARLCVKGDDNMIMVPADEFNAVCDKAEEFDDLSEEFERLQKLVKTKKAGELKVEDQLEQGKRGAAAVMVDKSDSVVVYHNELIVLPSAQHLFRTYEVLHAMKMHGERCEHGVRMRRDLIVPFMSDADNDDAKLRAYERWKKHLANVSIGYLSFMEERDSQFCIRDLEGSLQKITDLLTLRSVYDTGAWKNVKASARKMGLVNIMLKAEPVEAIFKYPSQSSKGDEVRPLQQDAGRNVPEKDYRLLRQGQ
ncbi:hypothetical protein J4219_01265 [Candidatus Woesearchaeota archaeon]|nr:hypothetical protein [Candidatus Woesearchaeota archaeon]